MAIPDRPLELNLPAIMDLTLDEAALLEPGGFSAVNWRKFLREYSNWSPEEIGGIKLGELRNLTAQVITKINEAALPLPK